MVGVPDECNLSACKQGVVRWRGMQRRSDLVPSCGGHSTRTALQVSELKAYFELLCDLGDDVVVGEHGI